jgi:hypothetical protein
LPLEKCCYELRQALRELVFLSLADSQISEKQSTPSA